jgi:hypothetical protein
MLMRLPASAVRLALGGSPVVFGLALASASGPASSQSAPAPPPSSAFVGTDTGLTCHESQRDRGTAHGRAFNDRTIGRWGPTRDWNVDNGEKVQTVSGYVNLARVLPNTEIGMNLEVMDSSNGFLFGGPRVAQLNTNTSVTGAAPCPAGVTDCFVPLPDVDSRWIELGADVRYFFARSVGVGLGVVYEDQDRADFATIDANGSVGFTTPTDTPRLDYLGGLVTGYGARPYRGITTVVRVLYRF